MIDSKYLLEVFKSSPNPCFIVLPDSPVFTIVAVSKVLLASISGVESEILNQSATKIFSGPSAFPAPITGATLIESFNEVIVTRKTQNVSAWSPDGMNAVHKQHKKHWEGESMPLFDHDDEIRYILYSAVEISEKMNPVKPGVSEMNDVKDEALLSENIHDRTFDDNSTILESIGDAFIRVDKNWVVTYWNNQAEKMLNQPRENILNKGIWEVYADAIDTPFYTNFQKAITENTNVRYEALYAPLELWLEVNVFPSDSGCSVYFKDISDRKKAAEKVRDSEEKNRLIMNAALDAIICMDKKGNITFWNPKATVLFGWDVKEVMGKKLSSFIIPEKFRYHHDAGLEKYLLTGEEKIFNHILEMEGTRRDGGLFPIELTVIPINQPNEQFFCAFIRDISARRKAEESIRQQALDLEISNKELEQFAYVASHDLQEPLRMVTSFLKQIESKYSNIIDDRGKQYIYFAVDGAKRMRQIILDLLEFSRVGRWDEKLELVDVKTLAEESLSLFANQVAETKAIIHIHPLPVISTYKTPFTQVLQNLLSNALKYRQEDKIPVIEISALESEDDWEFIIKDNGIGISSEYHERIFVIFQRLHNRDEYSGTGIGLAIVKKIISNMGGNIRVESEEGKGAAFHINIPKNIPIRRQVNTVI
jgi:PAS domain S-box-containing protein